MEFFVIITIAGFWVGFSKAGIGGPIAGAILLPLLTLIMTVPQAAGISLPLLIFADLFALRLYWREWDLHHISLLIPAALIGVILGTLLLTRLPDDILRHLLGIFTLLVIAYRLAHSFIEHLNYHPRRWHGYIAGFLAGFGSAMANAGGPPLTAYLLFQNLNSRVFIATVTLFFGIVNWLKVPGFVASGILHPRQLLEMWWIFLVIPIGAWIGSKTVNLISQEIFDDVMLVLLTIAALLLLFR